MSKYIIHFAGSCVVDVRVFTLGASWAHNTLDACGTDCALSANRANGALNALETCGANKALNACGTNHALHTLGASRTNVALNTCYHKVGAMSKVIVIYTCIHTHTHSCNIIHGVTITMLP